MSYLFDGSTGYAERTASTPVTVTPHSSIIWVKVALADLTGQFREVWQSYSASDADNYYAVRFGDTQDGKPKAISRNVSTGAVIATASSAIADSTWVMIHSRHSASDAARYAGHGGTNEGSESTTRAPDSTPSKFVMGAREIGSKTWFFKGRIAIQAHYNIDLSGAQLSELAITDPASASTAGNRVAYYDLRTDHGTTTLTDSVGTFNLTLGGSTKPSFDADNPTFASTPAGRMLLTGIG